MEVKKADKAKEQKRKQKERKKARDKAKAAAITQKRTEDAAVEQQRQLDDANKRRLARMTPRQRCAEAALKRLGGAGSAAHAVSTSAPTCSFCESPFPKGKAAFERLSFKYCAIACLKSHREELEKG